MTLPRSLRFTGTGCSGLGMYAGAARKLFELGFPKIGRKEEKKERMGREKT